MTDLILGMATGYKWNKFDSPLQLSGMCSASNLHRSVCCCGGFLCGKTIEPFAVSLRRSGYTGRCILIIDDSNCEIAANLAKYEIETRNIGKLNEHPFIARPIVIAKLIEEIGKDVRYLLAPDVRDVVFQSNPMTWIEEHIGDHEIIITTEGDLYSGETDFNKENTKRFIASFGLNEYERVKNRPVCNGGVIAGRPAAIKDLRIAAYDLGAKYPDGVPGYGTRAEGWVGEQEALNYVINTEAFVSRTLVVGPEGGFAFCCDHINHGATISEGVAYPPNSNTPYSIFHQYLFWRDEVWEKYSE